MKMRVKVFTLEHLFWNGMKREISPPKLVNGPIRAVNLGSGFSPIDGADNLDEPDWHAPDIPYGDETLNTVHAYHFFEHLDYSLLVLMLEEIERVLVPGGVLNYCVPYAMSPIAFMDASHRTFWTEETMPMLISGSSGYDNGCSIKSLRIHTQFIAGVKSQNLAILGQIVKE